MLQTFVGIPFFNDKVKDSELIMVIKGASIITNASFNPPMSLSQAKIVTLFLSCKYLLLDKPITNSNILLLSYSYSSVSK